MNFTDLSEKNKKLLHTEILSNAENIGGKNVFLQMIEDIREHEASLLSDKSKAFHFNGGNISWNKAIYKDTLALLFEVIKVDGDMFEGLKPKKQKTTLNMLKTLKPVIIRVKPKNMKDGEGFTLSIVKTDIKDNASISLMFKIIFFYHIGFAKEALAYDK